VNKPFVHPVRRATQEDAPAIGRMLAELGGSVTAPEPLAERVAELQARRNFVVLLAGTGPDGLAILRFRPSIWTAAQECYLAELYVRPARRRNGLGRALLLEALSVARAKGAERIELEIGADAVAAKSLGESLGFRDRAMYDRVL
jgi:ribosomal protein S18 acetylase RimI-like enzyme